jgi:hypothetical protein
MLGVMAKRWGRRGCYVVDFIVGQNFGEQQGRNPAAKGGAKTTDPVGTISVQSRPEKHTSNR